MDENEINLNQFSEGNPENAENSRHENSNGNIGTSDINTSSADYADFGNTDASGINADANTVNTDMYSPSEEINPSGNYAENSSIPEAGAGTDSNYQAQAFAAGNTARTQAYYTENFKKQKNKKSNVLQLIIVAVIGSVLGGGVVAAAFIFLAPMISPSLGSYFGSNTPAVAASDNGTYKKVEITQSDSPITAIAEKVSPSIVGIKVTIASQGQGFFNMSQSGVGEGSGIIIRQDGYILTNNHVVADALNGNSNALTTGSKIEVILPSKKDTPYTATVVGRDTKSDIAVIKINVTGLPTAELGNSDQLKTGELAVAIGNPAGIDYMGSVTSGIISGLNRTIQMDNGEDLTLIQTDAAINPGNSGGALCNSQGQVIGINTVKIAETGYEGLGFAIPINHAKTIAQSLIDYKYVKGRPYIGVSIDQSFTADVAKQYNVPTGLLVYDVTPLSAAYKAGILRGDIITKFDGQTVGQFSDLENLKNKHKPGDKVTVEIFRDNAYKTLTITLDEDKNQ